MKKIRKVHVSTGIYWVEIPNADVYILCACPENSVKHLKKLGLVVELDDQGVRYESGPNVILLSDIPVQNGEFSNLSEFPVLQMLYLQGMIIPNHPNNKGERPILLGSPEQLDAQMEYIYRGNYGLVSKEELMEAGMNEEEADEHMRMKLKYAFGKIRRSEELLEVREVGEESVEIKNGVTIKRFETNVYEISYEKESVTVNLNLSPYEFYKPPYLLGTYKVRRHYFGVIHSGEGDGWDYHRPCMSSIVVFQGKVYLIDAGPNLLHSLSSLGIGIDEIDGIFHTHGHDDHFAGLTALMRTGKKIKYMTSKPVRMSVFKKLSALMNITEHRINDFFEVEDLMEGVWNNIQGLEVMPIYSPHPIETNIFKFRALSEEGYKTYSHLADISSFKVLGGMIRQKEDDIGITQKNFDYLKEHFQEEASLKKIDIGGGLIHGSAEDFRNDTSEKLILSHTHEPLTAEQKEIGSGAPFGSVDALIPSSQEYVWRDAYMILKSYFPHVPEYEIKSIVNAEVITFNPESIIYRRGEKVDHVFLLLNGIVEMLQHGNKIISTMSSGAFIGEYAMFSNKNCGETYRASSFVSALKITKTLFMSFLQTNELENDFVGFIDNRQFLQSTWLFGEGISFSVLNKIAHGSHIATYKDGEVVIEKDNDCLMIVKKGSCQRMLGEFPIDVLSEGDFFCEELAILEMQMIVHFEALEDVEIYKIPTKVLKDIPIVNWKLFEIYQKRKYSLPL